jgi:hypothetical protein
LNPVRAGIVQRPEDYRWCSLGLLKKAPEVAKYLLTPVQLAGAERNSWEWYRSFVYESGGVAVVGEKAEGVAAQVQKAGAAGESVALGASVVSAVLPVVQAAKEKCQELQLDGRLINRIRNLSEGIVAGTARLIAGLQEKLQRSPREPRELWEGSPFFTTRVFHQPRLVV